MAKFSNKQVRSRPTAPIRTNKQRTLTYERGLGYQSDLESELFLMAATYLAGENTCLLYTSPSPRDATLSRMPSSA